MFIILTRNFPPEIGGMQNLMGGLANALLDHGPVKVFADKSEDFETKHNIAIRIKDDRYREFAKRILYLYFPDRIDSNIEKNVSELIHKRFNEEGPWPDAAKAYEELISKMETAEGSQKKILEKLQNFFTSSNN